MATNDRPEDSEPLVFRGVPDDLSGLDEEHPVVSMLGLRRRVLAAGVVTLGLFFAIAYLLTAVGANDGYVLLAVVLIYLLVTRPLMKPVREMTKLRRRLAYQAFLDGQQAQGQEPDGQQ